MNMNNIQILVGANGDIVETTKPLMFKQSKKHKITINDIDYDVTDYLHLIDGEYVFDDNVHDILPENVKIHNTKTFIERND